MKGFRYGIVLLVGFGLGWVAQSGAGIAMRKSANSRLLSENEMTLKMIRGRIARFKAREKRFPRGAPELMAGGDLDAANPPVESWRRSGRWVSEWDGEGGFVYASATGQAFLNADVSREKFFHADWRRVLDGDLFPPGRIF